MTEPQNHSLVYAGFWRRFWATILDTIFIICISLFVGVITGLDSAIYSLFSFIFPWLYEALTTSSDWQGTPGKKIIGLRVTDLQNRKISFWRATGRYFAKIISALLLMIGYFMAGFTARKQALHDMIAGTLVYMDNTSAPYPGKQDNDNPTNDFKSYGSNPKYVLAGFDSRGDVVRHYFNDADISENPHGLIIGRAPDCFIRISDQTISRQHAKIFLDQGRAMIEDLDSSNGTKLSALKLPPFQPKSLHNGVPITLGGVELVFSRQ